MTELEGPTTHSGWVLLADWLCEAYDLEDTEARVLMHIAAHVRGDGSGCDTSVQTMCRRVQRGETAVKRAIARLEEIGVVESKRRARRTTVRRLLFAAPPDRAQLDLTLDMELAALGAMSVPPRATDMSPMSVARRSLVSRSSVALKGTTNRNMNKNSPPLPPKGGRRRDQHDWEEELLAYARAFFPPATPAVVKAVEGALRTGCRSYDAIMVWLERWAPPIAELVAARNVEAAS